MWVFTAVWYFLVMTFAAQVGRAIVNAGGIALSTAVTRAVLRRMEERMGELPDEQPPASLQVLVIGVRIVGGILLGAGLGLLTAGFAWRRSEEVAWGYYVGVALISVLYGGGLLGLWGLLVSREETLLGGDEPGFLSGLAGRLAATLSTLWSSLVFLHAWTAP